MKPLREHPSKVVKARHLQRKLFGQDPLLPASDNATAHPELLPEVQQQMERLVGRRMMMSTSTSFLGYGTQAVLLHGVVPSAWLVAWVLALIVIEAANGTVAYFVHRPGTAPQLRRRLLSVQAVQLAVGGTIWGAVVLLPNLAQQPLDLLLQSAGLGVVAIMAVYNLSNDRPCLLAFNVSLNLGLVYGWWAGVGIPADLALAGLVVCVMCQIYGAAARRVVRELLLTNALNRKIALALAHSNDALEQLTEQLHRAASTDPLTGCLNRRALLALLESELARCSRGGDTFCVVLLDLDHFKSINDRHGHGVGDKVLVSTADVIRKQIRANDALGRWGGEEFVCLLVASDGAAGLQKAEAIRRSIEQEVIALEEGSLRITTSVGVASYAAGVSIDRLIDFADQKLYEAKQSGRNRVCS